MIKYYALHYFYDENDKNVEKKEKVTNEINIELVHSNPHQTLDHYKYLLRKKLLIEGKIKIRKEKTSLELSNIELTKLRTKLDTLLVRSVRDDLTQNEKIELERNIFKLKEGIEIANEPIDRLKNEESIKKPNTKRICYYAARKER